MFYIVSSDSDFTRLAMRIRESGKMVIGMGEKKTPESFVMACHDYIFFDGNQDACGSASSVSSSPSAGSKEKGSTSQKMTPGISRKLIALLREVVCEAAESDGWSETWGVWPVGFISGNRASRSRPMVSASSSSLLRLAVILSLLILIILSGRKRKPFGKFV